MVMNCPFCQSSQLMVVNSRPTKKNSQIWRRRKCLNCKGIFSTYEKPDLSFLIVVKTSGKREKYSHAKLLSSIYQAVVTTKGIDRGDSAKVAERLMQETEVKIVTKKEKRIKTSQIRDIVSGELKKYNLDAALRYVAYFYGKNGKTLKVKARTLLS